MSRSLLCVALVSCVPAPIDYTGKNCSTERACPASWDCVAMKCAGHNLLTNGDFEADGGTVGWEATVPLSIVTGHLGTHGARLSGTEAMPADVTLQPTDKFASGNDGATYCLAAWLAGTDGGSVELVMQTTEEIVGTATSATLTGTGGETRLNRYVDPQKLLFIQITGTLSSSDEMVVDDVSLWRSLSGTCSER